MPESPANHNLGMFMVCAEMRDQFTNLQDHACRSAILHFKSSLVRMIRTWLLSPIYVLGLYEEKQTVEVEIFSNYMEDAVGGESFCIEVLYNLMRLCFLIFSVTTNYRCLHRNSIKNY